VLKARNDTNAYLEELRQIVAADARAGSERTDRTRYLGATASLVLTEPLFGSSPRLSWSSRSTRTW